VNGRALVAMFVCAQPDCGGALAVRARGLVLGCRRCPAIYPVLAGVPVLVPSPPSYLASYRDAVLATLAEAGAATRDVVALIDQLAALAPRSEALGFGDDWTADEQARPRAATADPAIAGWLAAAPDPAAAIAAAVPTAAKVVLELGCGGNALAGRLIKRGRTVVVADLSLRAVVRTMNATGAIGAVVDAEALPLARGAADAIIAANLIDLLTDPDALLTAMAAALRPGGVAIISTPDPSLGSDDDDLLATLLADAGLAPRAWHRGVPWLRAHSSRHFQLYFAELVVADRARRRR